jgi:hypothetical protein
MEITCLIFLVALIRGLLSAIRNRQPAITTLTSNSSQSLCSTCAYAHIAHGFDDRRKLIACTYAGSVRPLKFAVSACTLYCNRNVTAQEVRVVGFAGFAHSGETSDLLIAGNSIGNRQECLLNH